MNSKIEVETETERLLLRRNDSGEWLVDSGEVVGCSGWELEELDEMLNQVQHDGWRLEFGIWSLTKTRPIEDES